MEMDKASRKKVLVVDDDPTIIKLLEGVLGREGIDVLTAIDGLEALGQTQKHKPDLIILDIMMPEVNGYEVCSKLKFDEFYKSIPIIILTSRDRELDPRIGQMMGIDYMQKPVDSEALLKKVRGALS
jgi:DNA-binding response OmpR family regulator